MLTHFAVREATAPTNMDVPFEQGSISGGHYEFYDSNIVF